MRAICIKSLSSFCTWDFNLEQCSWHIMINCNDPYAQNIKICMHTCLPSNMVFLIETCCLQDLMLVMESSELVLPICGHLWGYVGKWWWSRSRSGLCRGLQREREFKSQKLTRTPWFGPVHSDKGHVQRFKERWLALLYSIWHSQTL